MQRIRFEREAAPRVNAALVLRAEPPEDPLRDLDVAADLPAEALTGFLPEAAQASGVGSLRVRRSGGGAGFFAEADLGGLGIATGEFLEKKAGEPLTVRVEGVAGERWEARKLILAAEQRRDRGRDREGRTSPRPTSISTSPRSRSCSSTARARRAACAAASTPRPSRQSSSSWTWGSGSRPSSASTRPTARLRLRGDDWGVRDLRVRGRESDATLDIAVQSDQLRGRVIGERIDADFVREFFEQLDALDSRSASPTPSPGTSGNLAIAVDRVFYRRAEAEQLSAAVPFEHDDIHVRDLAFAVGEGRVSGRVGRRRAQAGAAAARSRARLLESPAPLPR